MWFSPRRFVPHLIFSSVSLFCHRELEIFALSIQIFLLFVNIMVSFFINTEILLILFQIFFLIIYIRVELPIKIWQKNYDQRLSQSICRKLQEIVNWISAISWKMYFITDTLLAILRIFQNSCLAGWEYRAFKLCVCIGMFTLCFDYYY